MSISQHKPARSLSNRELGQQRRRAAEARLQRFIDAAKDKIDWSGILSPVQAEAALEEIVEYAQERLSDVPGRNARARRRAERR